MISNYWSFFCFTSHLSLCLPVTICESALFKITFEWSVRHFYTEKIIRNLHTFKNNFWNAFISYNKSLRTDSCFQLLQLWFCIFPAWLSGDAFQKSCVLGHIFCQNICFFFNILFSKYGLKILATFLASFKGG